jgi:hypothetical protein
MRFRRFPGHFIDASPPDRCVAGKNPASIQHVPGLRPDAGKLLQLFCIRASVHPCIRASGASAAARVGKTDIPEEAGGLEPYFSKWEYESTPDRHFCEFTGAFIAEHLPTRIARAGRFV